MPFHLLFHLGTLQADSAESTNPLRDPDLVSLFPLLGTFEYFPSSYLSCPCPLTYIPAPPPRINQLIIVPHAAVPRVILLGFS